MKNKLIEFSINLTNRLMLTYQYKRWEILSKGKNKEKLNYKRVKNYSKDIGDQYK